MKKSKIFISLTFLLIFISVGWIYLEYIKDKKLQQACNRGDSNVCFKLGKKYLNKGEEEKALEFFNKSCKNGIEDGCSYAQFLEAKIICDTYPKVCERAYKFFEELGKIEFN